MSNPILLSENPSNGSFGVDPTALLSFIVDGISSVPILGTLNVLINNFPAIVNGVFQPGYLGSISLVGTKLGVVNASHPRFGRSKIYVYVSVSNATATLNTFYYFGVPVQTITNLVAKSWCDGRRVDLLWTNPPGVVNLAICRSKNSYCKFISDPSNIVYQGGPISGYVDGTGPIPSSYPVGTAQGNKLLDEATLYYYTIFISYETNPPFDWVWAANGQVAGLSVRDYYAIQGDYVYNLLPPNYRKADADPLRGSDQFLLKRYCRVLQCQVNLIRGFNEVIPTTRDPDVMPAGRIGEAANQTGILEAQAWDLGMAQEKAFDAGVLRRIAMSAISVYKKKGTCPGLVALTKMLTTWDSRCAEANEPDCGVDRLFYTYDNISKINRLIVASNANNPVIAPGSIVLKTATVFLADGSTSDSLPGTDQGVGSVAFILDALGTFVCVNAVLDPSGLVQTIQFEDPTAVVRISIDTTGGTGGVNFFQFTNSQISTTTYPWQFPSPDPPPQFGYNAFLGLVLKDSGGATFIITGSTNLAGIVFLTVVGTPASGAARIAFNFDGSGNPLFAANLYTGEFSLTLDPKWDARLDVETLSGPWSLITALGSINTLGFAPTPADVTVWVQCIVSYEGNVEGITANTLTDTAATWIPNQWAGFYLNPNWNQPRLYKIVGNTINTLIVDSTNSPDLTTVATAAVPGGLLPGSFYFILTENNSLKYSRLVAALPSFVPIETRTFVKFECGPQPTPPPSPVPAPSGLTDKLGTSGSTLGSGEVDAPAPGETS